MGLLVLTQHGCEGNFRVSGKSSSPEDDQALEQAPKEVVMVPILREFKKHLENALRHLV